MKWAEYQKEDDGHAIGEVLQLENNEFAIFKRLGVVKETTEPMEVVKVAAEASKKLDLEFKSTLRQEVDAALADALGRYGAASARQIGKGGKRPTSFIQTHDNALDDAKSGFKHFGEFHSAVRKACQNKSNVDERLLVSQKANGASENIDADGGYATPVEFATTVFDDIMSQDSLLPDCMLIPMTSNSIKLPAINYLTQGAYGVTANWEGEGVSIPTSKPKFRQPQLTLNKLAALVPVTSELLEDGLAIESIIEKLAGEAITYKINQAILNGTGVGQPAGIIGHPSTVQVARGTVSTFTSIDPITMRARLYSTSGGVWYVNKDTEPAMMTMQDANGRYLYFAPGSFGSEASGQSPNGRLLGYEVKPMYNLPSLASSGSVVLANLKANYALGYKASGVTKAMSIHLYFLTDEVAYRWTFRMDGRPMRDTTLAAANGTATYGSAVQLV